MYRTLAIIFCACIGISAQATTLNCQLKYSWPKGDSDLYFDTDQTVSVKLGKPNSIGLIGADADLVTKDGRFKLHMTAMAPAPGKTGSSFIRLGAMDTVTDSYISGNEVFVKAGVNPYNRAHLSVSPDFTKDQNKPAHGLNLDCTLD